jgi:hypothetical protein
VRLADLAGDGDYRLIVADQEKRMKVYKGSFAAADDWNPAGHRLKPSVLS